MQLSQTLTFVQFSQEKNFHEIHWTNQMPAHIIGLTNHAAAGERKQKGGVVWGDIRHIIAYDTHSSGGI